MSTYKGYPSDMRTCWNKQSLICVFVLLSMGCQKGFTISEAFFVSATPAPDPKPTTSSISFGTHHACALNSLGDAFCWGRAGSGQIAHPTQTNQSAPYKISDTLKFTKIVAGTHNTCALTGDGDLYCWGQNLAGSLGVGDEVQKNSPTQITTFPAKVIDFGISAPFNKFTEHIALSIDPRFGCALLETKEVYCWGDNQLGSIAQPSTTTKSSIPLLVTGVSNVEKLSVGAGHACVLIEGTGEFKCWGDNHRKQIDDSSTVNYFSPVIVSATTDYAEILTGGAFTCALNSSHEILCWGQNNVGQLGRGTATASEATPAAVAGALSGVEVKSASAGLDNVCVVTSTNITYCWGDNYSGQLGNGLYGSGTHQTSPYEMTALGRETTVMALGTFSMCNFNVADELRCWGHAYFGEVANGVMYGSNIYSPHHVTTFDW